MRSALLAQKPPSWVLRGGLVGGETASLDLDFQNNRYWQTPPVYGHNPSSLVTVSRASTGYIDDLSGNWTLFPSNVLRVTNKGALIEEGRTNSITNNSMQGAVVGTPGTLPTGWNIAAAVSLSTAVIGTGTQNGIDYIDLRVSGTPTSTSYVLTFNSAITASSGQNWTESIFAALVAGSLTNVTTVDTNLIYTGGASTRVPTSLTSSLVRQPIAEATATGSVTAVQPRFVIGVTSGLAVDLTVRIGWPQLELGTYASSPIRTTNATVLRAADVVTVKTLPSFGSAYVLFARGTPNAPLAYTANQFFGSTSDGTANNRADIVRNSAGNLGDTIVAAGVAVQNSQPISGATGTSHKIAVTHAPSDNAYSTNGNAVVSNTNVGTIATPTVIHIGSNSIGSAVFNGYVERIAVWSSVRLPNAILQEITT